MPDTVVTVKMSGSQYRELCRELEYRERDLKEIAERSSGADGQAAKQQFLSFQILRKKISE